MSKVFQFTAALLFLANGITAQADADSLKISSYRKGRILVGISGEVSSSMLDRSNLPYNASEAGNSYLFRLKLGKFVAEKNLLGISFHTSKTQLVGFIEGKAEILSIGPWYRLHMGNSPDLAFYLQSTVHYASYFGRSEGVQNMFTIDEEISANGINASLGLGASYAIADRIIFEVGVDYHRGRFWGTLTDNILAVDQDIILNRGKFVFSFGFAVLFGKLKEDE